MKSNPIYILKLLLLVTSFFCSAQNKTTPIYKRPVYENSWKEPSLHPDRIILNFGEDPSTTVNATWRTSTTVKKGFAQIAKATAAPKFWRTYKEYEAITTVLDGTKVKDAGIIANYHSVSFKNLEPNTLYGYRVGDGTHWSEWIQFKTASKTNDKFTFLYVGDAQNYILELWSRLIRQGFKKAPEASFIIHAGDLISEAHSEEQWEEWFKAGSFIHRMLPSIVLPGNHEYDPLYENTEEEIDELSIQWRPQFTLPENGPDIEALKETTYYMDFQDVRLITLNSNVHQKEQAIWLREVLSNNPNNWTIVTFHHPLYSASKGRSNKQWRALLRPIFDEFHVDLVLQGHDHSYARGRAPSNEKNLNSGLNKATETGTMYVVSVSGGKMYNVDKEGWEKWGAIKNRDAENTQLVQTITVDKDTINYRSYTATGDLYDSFDLIKNKKGPNYLIDRKDEAIAVRTHENTISYYDELPETIKNNILNKYTGFKLYKVSLRPDKKRGVYYDVDLINEKTRTQVELKIEVSGSIFEEEIEKF